MCGLSRQGIEGRDRGSFVRSFLHVDFGSLTRVPHVLQSRSAQQISDQFQLSERSGGLEQDSPGQQFGKDASH